MCCVLIALFALGPRIAAILWWLIQPARFNALFNSTILAIIGIIFLPWTTLMYMIVGFGGISGIEWLFMGLAVVADIASYGGAISKAD